MKPHIERVPEVTVACFRECYLRRTPDGALVFDECPDAQTHLTVPPKCACGGSWPCQQPDHAQEERRACATPLESLVPEGTLGKKGTWHVVLAYTEEP